MTTNQTIDGVPVFYAIDPLDAYPEPVGTDDKIERSNGSLWVHLNGKRSKLIGLQSLDFLISQLVQIKGEVFGTEPVSQPQDEPVEPFGYWLSPKDQPLLGMFHRVTEQDKIIDSHSVIHFFDAIALYAEQPAPVAITLNQVLAAYDYADSHPHKYLRGTTNWCAAVAHKLNACLDEVTRLNKAKD